MELVQRVHPASVDYVGEERFALAADDRVRVQKQVSGNLLDVLAAQIVPAGKEWSVTVAVTVTETDV